MVTTTGSMIDFVQQTFVTLFDGSPEKALRAVLVIMGLYVLTAAPLVAWVAYGLFQKDPKVSVAVNADLLTIQHHKFTAMVYRQNSSFRQLLNPSRTLHLLIIPWTSSKLAAQSFPKTIPDSLSAGIQAG